MKELLFKQFEKEIKNVKENDMKLLIEVVDIVAKNVNESNLELSIIDIKYNFDSIIMDDEDYDNCISIRESLLNKYKDVKSFKAGLDEFKNVLTGKEKSIKEFAREVVDSVDSKVKFTEVEKEVVQDNSESKIITEDGPISEEIIQLVSEIKDCIGTELFTEANFDERINKLHKSGLLAKIVLQNEDFKTEIAKEAGLDEVTDEEIEEFLATSLGFKLVKKGLQIKQLNYIIELIRESDEALKEENKSNENEEVIESNTNFTEIKQEEVVEEQTQEFKVDNSKPLMQQVIEKCNQDAEKIAKDLAEAEMMYRNMNTDIVHNTVIIEQEEELIEEPIKEQKEEVTDEKLNLDNFIEKEDPAKSFKSKNKCKHEGCNNKKHTSGYCAKHYKQLKEEGQI